MTRIDPNIRKPPKPEDVKPKGPRISNQKRERMNAEQEYNATSAIYKEQNPHCNYCDAELAPKLLQNDHIVSGTGGRSASLLHFDTWNTTCDECHKENPDRAYKAACKVINVLRSIERLQDRNFTDEEEIRIVRAILNRENGHVH